MTATILPATEEELRSGLLGRQLREYNYRFVGEYPEQQYIRLNAKDAQGKLLGGIRAFVFLHWLQLEVLFVHEAGRGQGLGSQLLLEAESQARALGAHHAYVTTFEWQAPAFYLKHGYTEQSRIERYAGPYYLMTLTKPL
jgi:GNAT superfamily N-acetyltransferase